MLVQLETPNEAVLGRITSLASEGRLTGAAGEQFNIRALREERPIPEQLREDYLKYRVDIRVLVCSGARMGDWTLSHHIGGFPTWEVQSPFSPMRSCATSLATTPLAQRSAF